MLVIANRLAGSCMSLSYTKLVDTPHYYTCEKTVPLVSKQSKV